MASKPEQVLEATKAMVAAALPDAQVARNPADQRAEREGGLADLYDGQRGEPEIELSPLRYGWSHQIPLVLTGWDSASRSAEELLDGMASAIGAAVVANRTLGGLIDWLDATLEGRVDAEEESGDVPAVQITLTAQYWTDTPL